MEKKRIQSVMEVLTTQGAVSKPEKKWAEFLGDYCAPEKITDMAVVFFAFWTIYCNIFSFWSMSFQALSRFAFVPVLFSFLIFYNAGSFKKSCIGGLFPVKIGPELPPRIPEGLRWSTALFILLLFFLTKNLTLFWGLSVGYLFCLWLDDGPRLYDTRQSSDEKRKLIALLGIALLAVIVTLFVHRPDADDAMYLNFIVSALDFPDRAFLKFDAIHGFSHIPISITPYRLHSYEMLVALLARISGLRPIVLYHLVLPCLSAVLVVFANYLVLRQVHPQKHLWGLLFVVFIFLLWGESHRAYSNFAFVRLFQGKAVMISACIPLVYLYAINFIRKRTIYSWLMLFLIQVAAVGFSSSALVVAPLASSFVILGSWWPNTNRTRLVVWGLMTSLYVVFAGVACTYEFIDVTGIGTGNLLPERYQTISGMQTVMGDGWMMYFALFSLLVCTIRTREKNRTLTTTGIVLFVILITMSPWTSDLISRKIAGNMSWRIFWALPAPLFLGLAVTHILEIGWRLRGIRVGPFLYLAAIIFCAAGSKGWAVGSKNNTTISSPTLKVDRYYDVARVVRRLTPDKGMALVPSEVAKWVPTFSEYPFVIVSRPMYLTALKRHVSESEIMVRLKMQKCVDGHQGAEMFLPLLFDEVRRREIDTVVYRKDNPMASQLEAGLKGMKFQNSPFEMYDVWLSSNNVKKEE